MSVKIVSSRNIIRLTCFFGLFVVHPRKVFEHFDHLGVLELLPEKRRKVHGRLTA
jgi:hypothetical protein